VAQQFFLKFSDIRFQDNLQSFSEVISYVQMDGPNIECAKRRYMSEP
jgi:hypothetical protein